MITITEKELRFIANMLAVRLRKEKAREVRVVLDFYEGVRVEWLGSNGYNYVEFNPTHGEGVFYDCATGSSWFYYTRNTPLAEYWRIVEKSIQK